jgi:hypothetical protein
MTKNKHLIFLSFVFILLLNGYAQNNTFNPYSRYGLGELSPTTLAHNAGMGGAFIALKSDSTMPIFINTGNPASYSLIKLTSLEVGGNHLYSQFKSNAGKTNKWGTNFSYATLGFPIRRNGGASFGLMPYSSIGYDVQSTVNENSIGNVSYKYNGSGNINKAFIGYGVMPFDKSLERFRRKRLYIPDTLKNLSRGEYLFLESFHKLLSDFSIGGNLNYLFGSILNTTKVEFPNSLLYNNSLRDRSLTLGSFTGNFGVQTALTIDSVMTSHHKHRVLKEKVKFTFGYFMAFNSIIKATSTSAAYNYILNGSGQEIIRDTVYYKEKTNATIRLPLEQGFGIGYKKGDRLNLVADFAITQWQNFKYLDEKNSFKNNYRIALGGNFVPEKYASGRGSFVKRMNYRLGASYQTGYINISNNLITDYYVSAGLGIPVGIGRLSSMINISTQIGKMGTLKNNLMQHNYWRINFGFTFTDRWFQKFRYD